MPTASTASTCHTESCASAAVISAQWSLKVNTMMQVSASSTSREITVFLREGCCAAAWLMETKLLSQPEILEPV